MTRSLRRRASSSAKRASAAPMPLTLRGGATSVCTRSICPSSTDVLEHAGQLVVEMCLVATCASGASAIIEAHPARRPHRRARSRRHRAPGRGPARAHVRGLARSRSRPCASSDIAPRSSSMRAKGSDSPSQDERRHGDRRPVLGTQAALRLARQVQRVGEADEPPSRRLLRPTGSDIAGTLTPGDEERGHATAVRVAADDESGRRPASVAARRARRRRRARRPRPCASAGRWRERRRRGPGGRRRAGASRPQSPDAPWASTTRTSR